MNPVTADDIDRMRATLDVRASKAGLSRFWVLLFLAAVIAASGVIADSTAVVIGAMIVAPLMTPILGVVFAVVSGDASLLLRSATLVVTGAMLAIAVGYLLGIVAPFDVVAETNGQVAGRVSPRVIDLVAALATGAVGAFAQCRQDISDTLPGVAIAISLVPPLTVIGLTLSAGAMDQAIGALLLFATNVAATLLAGSLVMVLFGVHQYAHTGIDRRLDRRRAAAVVVAFAIVVVGPLTLSTVRINSQRLSDERVVEIARSWAEPAGWTIVGMDRRSGAPTVTAIGPPPAPDPAELQAQLVERGEDPGALRVRLLPEVVFED